MDQLDQLGLLSRKREHRLIAGLVEKLRINLQSPRQPVLRLSGGNQQKVAIAKWLPLAPQLYLLAEPTRGIDVGTKQEIYRLMRELTAAGASILLISSDTLELIGLCDRILVMYERRPVALLAGDEVTEEKVVRASIAGTLDDRLGDEARARGDVSADGVPSGGGPRRAAVDRRAAAVAASLAESLAGCRADLRGNARSRCAVPISDAGNVWREHCHQLGRLSLSPLSGGDGAIGDYAYRRDRPRRWPNDESGDGRAGDADVRQSVSKVKALVIVLVGGGLLGMFTGGIVTFVRLPAIIVTLATSFIWAGAALFVLSVPGGHLPLSFAQNFTGNVAGVLPVTLLVIGGVLVLWKLIKTTPLGLGIYAIGDNPRGAFVSGVPVQRARIARLRDRRGDDGRRRNRALRLRRDGRPVDRGKLLAGVDLGRGARRDQLSRRPGAAERRGRRGVDAGVDDAGLVYLRALARVPAGDLRRRAGDRARHQGVRGAPDRGGAIVARRVTRW